MLYAGRVVAGFCVGVVSLCFPVYLGETLQPEVRGMLGLLPTALGNVGKLATPRHSDAGCVAYLLEGRGGHTPVYNNSVKFETPPLFTSSSSSSSSLPLNPRHMSSPP
jgi:MFS family permease